MMMEQKIKHHLTDEILMAYAAGTLPEAFSLLVAAHVSLCDDCRARLEAFEAVGGALLADYETEPVDIDPGSLEATFALIAEEADQPAVRVLRHDPVLPVPLQDYIGGGLDQIKWRSIGLGVKQAILTTHDTATARLIFIPAGASIPDHGHEGTEMTMVLQGAFSDEFDRFERGDVEVANSNVQHTPVAGPDADCICLVVSDAPLRFEGIIPKIVQRIARI